MSNLTRRWQLKSRSTNTHRQTVAEIEDCRALLRMPESSCTTPPETPIELLRFITSFGDRDVFLNLATILQILLTIGVSVASCERSFSKLKLIHTYLLSTCLKRGLPIWQYCRLREKLLRRLTLAKLSTTMASTNYYHTQHRQNFTRQACSLTWGGDNTAASHHL